MYCYEPRLIFKNTKPEAEKGVGDQKKRPASGGAMTGPFQTPGSELKVLQRGPFHYVAGLRCDPGVHPYSPVLIGRACGHHRQNQLNGFAGQGAEVHLHVL